MTLGHIPISGNAISTTNSTNTAYTLTATVRTYSVNFTATIFGKTILLPTNTPAINLVGKNTGFVWNHVLTTSTRSFAVAGIAVNVKRAGLLPTTVRTYSLTGTASNLLDGNRLLTTTRTYAVTGNTNTFLRGYRVIGSVQTYGLSGKNLNLLKGFYLGATSRNYALAGSANTWFRTYVLNTVARAYAITGVTSILKKGYYLPTTTRSYSLTHNPGLFRFWHLNTTVGVFGYNGKPVNLLKGFVVGATKQTYSLTGIASNGRFFELPAPARTYSATFNPISFKRGYVAIAAKQTYSLTPVPNSFRFWRLSTTPGTFNDIGKAIGTLRNYRLLINRFDYTFLNTTTGDLDAGLNGMIDAWNWLPDGEWWETHAFDSAAKQDFSVGASSTLLFYGKNVLGNTQPYSVDGSPVTYSRAYILHCAVAPVAVTPKTTILEKGTRLSTTTRTYSLTGISIPGLKKGFAVVGTKQTYAVTSIPTIIFYGRTIQAVKRTYTINVGLSTGFLKRVLVATPRTYSLVGKNINLLEGNLLVASKATFNVTNFASNFVWNKVITANTRSFALAGSSAVLNDGHAVIASQRTYAVSGINVNLLFKHVMPAATRSYAVNANASALTKGYYLAASTRSFAVTGFAVSLIKGFKVTSNVTPFTLTGVAAAFRRDYRVTGVKTSYFLGGFPVTMLRGYRAIGVKQTYTMGSAGAVFRYWHLNTTVGTFNRTNVDATLERGYNRPSVQSTYTLVAGGPVGSIHQYVLTADLGRGAGLFGSTATQGDSDVQIRQWNFLQDEEWFDSYDSSAQFSPTYSLSFSSVSIGRGLGLPANVGVFNLVGKSANIFRTAQFATVVRPYALTGNTINLKKGFYLAAAPRTYSVTGNNSNLLYSKKVITTVGVFGYNGKVVNLLKGFVVSGAKQTYTLTGNALNPAKGFLLAGAVRTYSVTGLAINLRATRTLPAAVRTYTVTSIAAGLYKGFKFPAAVRSYTVNGNAASFNYDHLISTSRAYSLVGKATAFGRTYVLKGATQTYNATGGTSFIGTRFYILLAEYAQGPGLFGTPSIDSGESNLIREWNFLQDEDWFDSYDRSITISPSFPVVASSISMAKQYYMSATKTTFSETAFPATIKRQALLSPLIRQFQFIGYGVLTLKGFVVTGPTRNYSVAPTQTTLRFGHYLGVTTNAYNVTGNSNSFFWTHVIKPVKSTYTMAGFNIVLGEGHKNLASTQSYSLVGNSASSFWNKVVTGVRRTYTLSAFTISVRKGFLLRANPQAYAVIVDDPAFLNKGFKVTGVTQTYAVTTNNAGVYYGHKFPATTRAYSIIANNAGVYKGFKVGATPRSYSVTSISTNFKYNRIFVTAGAFSVSSALSLLKGFVMPAAKATFSEAAGGNVANKHLYVLTADYTGIPGLYGAPATVGKVDPEFRQWEFLDDGEWTDSYDLASQFSPTYSTTGVSVSLTRNLALGVSVVPFTVTRNPVNVKADRRLAAAVSTCTVTGKTINLLKGSRLFSNLVTYNFTGVVASLLKRSFFIEVVTFTVTPKTVNWFRRYVLTGTPRSYSVNSVGSATVHNYVLTTVNRTFALTGVVSKLNKGSTMSVTKAVFNETTSATNLFRTTFVSAAARTYNVNTVASKLLKGFTTVNPVRTFTVNSFATGLIHLARMTAAPVAYTVTRNPGAVFATRRFITNNTPFVLNGYNVPNLLVNRKMAGVKATYTETAFAVNGPRTYVQTATSTRFFLTPYPTFLAKGDGFAVNKAVYTVAGQNVNVRKSSLAIADRGMFQVVDGGTILRRSYTMPATAASIAAVGQIADKLRSYTATVSSNSFMLTGKNNTLLRKYVFPTAFGQFAANASTFSSVRKGYFATIDTKVRTIVGNSAKLLKGSVVIGAVAPYSLVGIADITAKNYKVVAQSTIFTATSVPFSTQWMHRMPVAPGVFNMAGVSQNVILARVFTISKGTFTETPSSVNFYRSYVVSAVKATYLTGTGQSGTSRKYTATANTGIFNFTGIAVNYRRGSAIAGIQSTFTFSGVNVAYRRLYVLTATVQGVSVIGKTLALTKTRPINVTKGSFVLTGNSVSFTRAARLSTYGYETAGFHVGFGQVVFRRTQNVASGPHGLTEEPDTWKTFPVADSVYKDVAITEETVDVSKLEVHEDVTKEEKVDISARIRQVLADASTPPTAIDAEIPTPSVTKDVKDRTVTLVNAKIKEYR